MKKVLHWLDNDLEEFLMLLLLAAISCVTMLQIIMRYCFSSALSWPEEFCRFCFVYTGALSAGYCMRRGLSLRVDLIVNFMPGPLKILIDYAGKLLTLFVYVVIFYNSFGLIATTTALSTAMQLPYKVVYAAFPLGMGLGIIRCVQDLISYTRKTFGKKEEEKAC
ncbi:MAG: TRAP transporter small permease [Lachnospiraceae bacterium]|nr:TRAP transporter small permease [Lachnospiraceae bacterium]